MAEQDQAGDKLGPAMPEPERQYCGRMLEGGLPCMAPATVHGDFGDSLGFACDDHTADFIPRCIDTHQVDTACGLANTWQLGPPSCCRLDDDALTAALAAFELSEAPSMRAGSLARADGIGPRADRRQS